MKTFTKVMRSIIIVLMIMMGWASFDVAAQSSQTYTFKNVKTGAGGGYIVNVIFHPQEKDLIYAKTDIGGAYRWDPSSQSWVQLFHFVSADDWNWTGIESIAVDPSDPDKLYVAGGTYTNSWAGTNGVIWRSTDRGNNFVKTDMPFKMGGNMPGRGMGERLAVDPNNSNILYFGARDGYGLWKSTDSAVSWERVENFTEVGPYMEDPDDTWDYNNHPVGVCWVIFDPSTGGQGSPTQTIYVGTAQNEPGKPSIYRSLDAGATWEPVPGQPVSSVEGTIVTITGGTSWDMAAENDNGELETRTTGLLPHNGKLDSNGTLYVTYSNFAGPYQGNRGDVWKFEPSTSAWTKINPATPENNYLTYGSQYWGYGGLAIDMQNPGTIVVTAVNSWWPDGMMFRTTDGGETWVPIWEYAGYPSVKRRYSLDISSAPWLTLGRTGKYDPEPDVMIGWMMDGINIDPHNPDRMMYGTGAALYCTDNLTAWDQEDGIVAIRSMANGMEETSVLDLISPPSGTAHLVSAVGDVGGWVHEDLDSVPATGHTIPEAGTMNSLDFAQNNPDFMVIAGNGTGFTYNAGGSWFKGNTDISPGQRGGTIVAAADASRVIWAPADGVPVSYSTDNGNSWYSCANIPSGSHIASDRVNAKKFYGVSGGTFRVSVDGGETFTATITDGFPENARVEAVFGIEGDVWVVGSSDDESRSGVWHSTNSGATFTRLSDVTAADKIGFGKADPNGSGYPAVFLCGTINGTRSVYRSDDMGVSWVNILDSKHQFATVQCITGDPRIYGRVYMGTNGFGIIYGDIKESISYEPEVSIVSPTNNSQYNEGDNIIITAEASDVDGTISKVEFYNGSEFLGEDTTDPYTYTIVNAVEDSYVITAKAIDNDNLTNTSAEVFISKKTAPLPYVEITAPQDGDVFQSGAEILISANALDADSRVTKVEFYDGSEFLGEDLTRPYSFTIESADKDSYSLTAVATYEFGNSVVSEVVTITKAALKAPTVTIIAPADGKVYNTGDDIVIEAEASDIDGTISEVEFFNGSESLGVVTQSPYSVTISNAQNGDYIITAVATDNDGLTAVSSGVSVSVKDQSNDYNVIINRSSDWGQGFVMSVDIENNSDQPVEGWTLQFTFYGNETINNMWGGEYTQTGQSVVITPLGYTNVILPNSKVSLGFVADYTGNSLDPGNVIFVPNP